MPTAAGRSLPYSGEGGQSLLCSRSRFCHLVGCQNLPSFLNVCANVNPGARPTNALERENSHKDEFSLYPIFWTAGESPLFSRREHMYSGKLWRITTTSPARFLDLLFSKRSIQPRRSVLSSCSRYSSTQYLPCSFPLSSQEYLQRAAVA